MSLLSYHFVPTGKSVVALVHGFLGSAQQWKDIIPAFNAFDVLCIELPGHGDSKVVNSYSIMELAHELNQILIAIEVDKIHYVGHSMGGYVGCAFAEAYSHQLHSLTLINSIAGADTVARKQLRNRAIQLIDRFQDTYVSMAISNLFTRNEHESYASKIDLMKQQAKKISLPSVLAALRAMRDRESHLASLENLNIPIIYMYGAYDTVIDPMLVKQEVDRLKSAGYCESGGHMLLITHPMKLIENMHFTE